MEYNVSEMRSIPLEDFVHLHQNETPIMDTGIPRPISFGRLYVCSHDL